MMKLVLAALWCMNSAWAGGNGGATGVGGAGNATVAEFYLYVHSLAAVAQKYPSEVSRLISVEKLTATASSVIVTAMPSPLLLNGNKVDAINYPDQGKIQVDDTTWIQRSIPDKYQIVVHELLGLMRVNDSDFRVSQAITDATLARFPFKPASVNSCVDASGKDIHEDIETTVALIAQQTTCHAAAALATACSWGTSGDVRKAWTAYRICESELKKDNPNEAIRAQLVNMENSCESKYAAKEGSMYESLNSYCHLSAIHWIVDISKDWSR